MPERQVSSDALALGAHVGGWLLTGWTVLLAVLSLTTFTVVGDALCTLGYPHAVMTAALVFVAVLQLSGHISRSTPTLILGDLTGGLVCMTAASLATYASIHGDNAAICAANWGFVGCTFLLHASMLRQR